MFEVLKKLQFFLPPIFLQNFSEQIFFQKRSLSAASLSLSNSVVSKGTDAIKTLQLMEINVIYIFNFSHALPA
jgi:hypothetical protein